MVDPGPDWIARIAKAVCRRIVGCELLELLPRPEQHASDFAVARLAHRMLLAGLLAGEGT